MGAYRKRIGSNGPLVVGASLAACGLAALASFTHPFTLGADVVTAIPLAGLIVAETLRLLENRGSQVSQVLRVVPVVRALRSFIPWVVLSGAVVGFELFSYFEQPRRAHPTLSSLSDDLTRSQAGRAVLFLAWLALGVFLFRSATTGTRHRATRTRGEL